ncbi:MAG: carboxylesterase family protein, partial [Sphingomonadales bacterium]|nr:carboxylesterase family protein [Sphingomonadales bacterium]
MPELTRRTVLATGLAGTAGLALPGTLHAADSAVPTAPVATTSGTVRGLRQGGVSRFFGIRYGQDTGLHRFQPPRAPQPWQGVRDCNTLGAKTPQGMITIPGVM